MRRGVLGLLIVLMAACQSQPKKAEIVPVEDSVVVEKPVYVFDIEATDYNVHWDKIAQGKMPSEIFQECNITPLEVHEMVQASKDIFDFKYMKAGRPYTVLANDSTNKAEHIIYEMDPENYVVFNFKDSISCEIKKREIHTEWTESSGVIESSLFLTMEENGLSPRLAFELGNVYAWSVDFFHIQKGDWFKVIHQNKYADGEYIGIGDISAVIFNHHGQDYYAFYMPEDGDGGNFYDERKESLQGAFLKAPLKFFRISSRYSKRRFHPVQKRYKPHLGTDYAAAHGTPILATANGTVSKKGYTRGNGNYVKIKHNEEFSTQYLHMSRFEKGVDKGTRVKQGQVIGYVGKTGLATGPHVCYRFWRHGKQVDPLKIKLPSNKKLKEAYHADFEILADSLKTLLDAIPMPEAKQPEQEIEDSLETNILTVAN